MKELLTQTESLSFGQQQWSTGVSAGLEVDKAWKTVLSDRKIARDWKRKQELLSRQVIHQGKKQFWSD